MIPKPPSSKLTRWVKAQARRAAKLKADRVKREAEQLHTALMRAAVYEHCNGHCLVCCRRVYLSTRNPFTLMHRHHIIYRSAGGSDELENQCGICGACHADEHEHRIDLTGTRDYLILRRKVSEHEWGPETVLTPVPKGQNSLIALDTTNADIFEMARTRPRRG